MFFHCYCICHSSLSPPFSFISPLFCILHLLFLLSVASVFLPCCYRVLMALFVAVVFVVTRLGGNIRFANMETTAQRSTRQRCTMEYFKGEILILVLVIVPLFNIPRFLPFILISSRSFLYLNLSHLAFLLPTLLFPLFSLLPLPPSLLESLTFLPSSSHLPPSLTSPIPVPPSLTSPIPSLLPSDPQHPPSLLADEEERIQCHWVVIRVLGIGSSRRDTRGGERRGGGETEETLERGKKRGSWNEGEGKM